MDTTLDRESRSGEWLPAPQDRPACVRPSAVFACPDPDGGAAVRGLPAVFRRLPLPMRRRADGGRALALIGGFGTGGCSGARAGSVRCAAVGLLVACAVLLFLPLQVQAQVANADPSFTSASAVSVDENTKGNNTKFSYTVSAVDDDPMDTVTLALTGGAHQSDFTFDPANGELSAKAKFDHESLPANADGEVILTVEFTATSGIGSRERTATQTLNITVNDVPELPRPVDLPNTVTRVGSNFIEIFWFVNERNRPANLHYEIEYRVSGTTAWTAWPNMFTTLVGRVTGLMPETMYQLQVRAVNDDGPGGWRGPVTGETDIPDSNDCAADATTACSVTVGSSARSTLLAFEDVDWFSVDLDAGVHYSIYMDRGGVGSAALGDPEIQGIYNSESAIIDGTGDQDSGEGVESFVAFVPGASGTHYVAATSKGTAGRSGLYDLWVAVQRPTTTVSEGSVDLPDHAGTRGHVLVGGTATGTIVAGVAELDVFGMVLEQEKAYRIEVKGNCATDSGGSLGDPNLGIRSSLGPLPRDSPKCIGLADPQPSQACMTTTAANARTL